MRGNARNTGASPNQFQERADTVIWSFQTGNAIFSTPVINRDEHIYVGSADHRFYALDPLRRKELWQFAAGSIIDSAACIDTDGNLYVPSGDACLYKLSPAGQELWRFDLLARRERTSSTIYWWEANATIGPSGWIYAGNDDFCLYALTPEGELRWSFATGLQIWSAPAFAEDLVYVSSFDMHVYALDQQTGRMRWKRRLSNCITSSPAVDAQGNIYVGCFDGAIFALDGRTGEIRWRFQTSGSVYASAALAPDGLLIIAASDGNVYALESATGKLCWIFSTGGPLWGSAAAGPDPAGRDSYLLYLGDHTGALLALEPGGRRRWSYRPAGDKQNGQRSINASPALGTYGLAAASVAGEILYVPYDAYLRFPATPGMEVTPVSHHPDGSFLTPANDEFSSLPATDLACAPGEIVHLSWNTWQSGKKIPTTLERVSLPHASADELSVRFFPSENRIALIPPSIETNDRSVHIRIAYAQEGIQKTADRTLLLSFQREPRQTSAPPLPRTLRIGKILFATPAILTPLDQIGIASLHIDVCIVRDDPATGRFVAWGLQTFGLSEEGTRVGIPQPRYYFYAFHGIRQEGVLRIKAAQCDFEITAFPLPLDVLSITAAWNGKQWDGISVQAEMQQRHLLWKLVQRYGLNCLRFLCERIIAFPLAPNLPEQVRSASRTFLCVCSLLFAERWKAWGLLDGHGNFTALGTCAIEERALRHHGLRLCSASFDDRTRIVTAVFEAHASTLSDEGFPGILLLDCERMRPVVLPYSYRVRIRRTSEKPIVVTLEVPHDLDMGTRMIDAVILVNCTVVTTLRIGREG